MRLSSCCESFVLAGPETGLQAVSIHMLIRSSFLFDYKTVVLWLYWGKIQTIKRKTIEINPITILEMKMWNLNTARGKTKVTMLQLKQTLLSTTKKVDPGQVHTQDSQRNGTELGQSIVYKGQSHKAAYFIPSPSGGSSFCGVFCYSANKTMIQLSTIHCKYIFTGDLLLM